MKLNSYKDVEVGGVYDTLYGGKVEVLELDKWRKVRYRFLDTGYEGEAQTVALMNGTIKNWGYSLRERIGENFPSTSSGRFTVVEYLSFVKVRVVFNETRTEVWTTSQRIEKGLVCDPMAKNIGGYAYLGIGPYTSYGNKKAYTKWLQMVLRCVSDHPSNVAYLDKSVHPDWSCFQTFAEWAEKQIGFNENDCQLDKDILVQGNKIYGPDTCCFVPFRINNLITGGFLGGSVSKSGRWTFAVCKGSKKEYAHFATQAEGLLWYKDTKEEYIKEVADEYKNVLDSKVYAALYSWQVN